MTEKAEEKRLTRWCRGFSHQSGVLRACLRAT